MKIIGNGNILMTIKKNTFISSMIIAAIGLTIGIVLTVCGNTIASTIFIILGIFVIINSIPTFISSLAALPDKNALVVFVMSAVSLIMGFVMIFFRNEVFTIIVGIYLLLLPIYRIITASDKKAQFTADAPSIILGLVLILVGPGKLIVYVGIVMIAVSVVYAIYSLISYLR